MFRKHRGVRELSEGESLGSYRLGRKLGEGGMGVVFLAEHEPDGRKVALKVLKQELAADETYRKRFTHEIRAARETNNKHLVSILESGEAEGHPYLATEYVEGGSLTDHIRQRERLSVEATVRIAGEIASGLDALHRVGIVHRDVKPSNILLRKDGTAMLTDFGLAKGRAYTVLTRPGQVMGTLDYLAPELIKGRPADAASDIYALGCVVFECLAGGPPFAGKSVLEVGVAHLEEDPPDPCAERDDAAPSLSFVVLQGLRKDPPQRPKTATAFANMLSVAARESQE